MTLQKERLRLVLDLRPGEGSLVGLLLLHSLLQGVALAYFFTAANALFLEQLDVHNLSWVFLAAGIVSAALAMVYSRLEHKVSFERLLEWSVIVLVPVVLLLRILLVVSNPVVIAFILLVWYHVMHYLIDSRFWELSAVLFDVRQSKRLFGVVSLGESVAKVLGYLSVPLLVYLSGTDNLLLFAAAALTLSLPALRRTLSRYGDRLAVAGHGIDATDSHRHDSSTGAHLGRSTYPPLADRRYLVLLLLFTLFSFSAIAFLEYGFLGSVQRRFVHDGEIAPFLGLFFGVAKALNIAARAFFSGRFIRRYGLLVGLALLPAVLLVLSIIIVGLPLVSASDRLPLIFFGFAVVVSEVLRGPLANTAYLILFQPLPPKRRLAAHTLAKAKGEPAALVVSGAILVAITMASGSILYVSIALSALMLGWIVVSVLLGREYVTVIRDSLRKRVLRGSAIELEDPTTMSILESRIRSQDPAEVVYALGLLAQAGHEKLEEYLLELAAHDSPIVRREALRRIDELRVREAAPLLSTMIESELDTKIRGYAVMVYAVVAGERALDRVSQLVDDVEEDIAAGAMTGLLRSGGLQGVIVAGQRLMSLTTSHDPKERALAARIIGEVGNPGFYHPLVPLLDDEDRRVSEAAVRAAGEVANPDLIARIAEALLDPRTSESAASALARTGTMAMPALRGLFARCDDPHVLRRMCRVAERIGGAEAVAFLMAALVHPRRDVRDQAARSLALGPNVQELADRPGAYDGLRSELADAALLLMQIRRLGEYGARAGAVVGALRYELERLRARVMLLLTLLYDRGSILRARDRLDSRDAALRANAIEILELTVDRSVVDVVLPLFEERDHDVQYAKLAAAFPHEALTPAACLSEIVTNDTGRHSAWTRACALQLALDIGAVDLDALMPSLLASSDAIVAETAADAVRKAEAKRKAEEKRRAESRRKAEARRANEAMAADESRAAESIAPSDAEPSTVALPDSESPRHDAPFAPDMLPFVEDVSAVAESVPGLEEPDAYVEDELPDDRINEDHTTRAMVSTIEKVMTLKLTDMFAETPEEILTDVAEAMQEIYVPAGTEIIRKGEPGNCMYIIHEGSVRVHDGEHEFGRFGARDHFGELSLLDPEPRSASVTTIVDTHLLRLDQDALYEIMADSVDVARGILRNLTRKLRAQNELIVRLEGGGDA